MKKQQDHILWTLQSKEIQHIPVDIADPNRATERDIMRKKGKRGKGRVPLPPQVFNDDDYIGVCVAYVIFIKTTKYVLNCAESVH